MSTTLNQLDALLAEVQRMRDEQLRLQEENERLKIQVAPVPVVYPVGTRHVWQDNCRRVVAIQLKDGILQVKDVTSGKTAAESKYEVCKKFYKSLAAWRDTLPEGGTVKSEATDGLTGLQRRLKEPFPSREKGDCDALEAFSKRWSVNACASENLSPAELLESYRLSFYKIQKEVGREISLDNLDPYNMVDYVYKINRMKKFYILSIQLQKHNKTLTNEQLYYKPLKAHIGGRAALYAFIQGQRYRILLIKKSLYDFDKSEYMACNGRKGKTFAELGIDLKSDGTPKLGLSYRRYQYEF